MRISDWSSDVCSSDLRSDTAGGEGLAGLFRRNALDHNQVLRFTQQLSTLLGAGQPLDRALGILIDLPESPAARALLGRVRDTVRGGAPLSTALDQQHGVFSRLYINMVRAGEAGGSLQASLARLADRSEEHTSELQSLMRISYAVFCLKKKHK